MLIFKIEFGLRDCKLFFFLLGTAHIIHISIVRNDDEFSDCTAVEFTGDSVEGQKHYYACPKDERGSHCRTEIFNPGTYYG